MSTVEQQVKAIVAEQLGVKQEQVTNDASFVDDLGADSLDTVELVMALEEEFEIEIPDEDAEKITTVQQAIEYINDRRTKAWPKRVRCFRPGLDRGRKSGPTCYSFPRLFIQVACEQASRRRHWPRHHFSRR